MVEFVQKLTLLSKKFCIMKFNFLSKDQHVNLVNIKISDISNWVMTEVFQANCA